MAHRTCSLDGCGKPLVARELCGMHYRRWRLYGDPRKFAPPKPPQAPEARFWPRVAKGEDCWEWRGRIDHDGYGRFHMDGKTHGAHRAAWVFTNGPVPDGLCVLHRCDNPRCVNPAHLWLGTTADNNADRAAKGRSATTHYQPTKPPRYCDVEGCDARHLARGYCAQHYREWHRERRDGPVCSVDGCEAQVIARGWCPRHYKRWQVHGDPLVEWAYHR